MRAKAKEFGATLRHLRRLLAVGGSIALLALAASCTGSSAPGDSDGMVGRAEIALMNVPADGTCIQVIAEGYRTVSRSFSAAAGASAVFEMGGLPLGQVTFTANAFSGSCPAAVGSVPTWVSDAAFTTTIAVTPPALATLNLVHNGSAIVSVGFNDGADGGASSSPADAGASGGGAGAGSQLMQVAGVLGESTAAGFVGWFDIDSFDLDALTPISANTGSGAGAGKTSWTASATLRLQQGVPELLAAEAKGTRLTTVVFAMLSAGPNPSLVWRATLSSVLIASAVAGPISSGDQVPEESITFVFGSLRIEFVGQPGADGGVVPAVSATFNLATNTGPGAPGIRPPLSFVFGGPAVAPQEAISAFQAPSESTPVSSASSGSGAATGKTTFSDASVTLPFDVPVLTMLIEQVAGVTTPTASVQIDGPGATAIGSYGFKTVQVHETKLSSSIATVAFGAQSFSWTFGTETTTFP